MDKGISLTELVPSCFIVTQASNRAGRQILFNFVLIHLNSHDHKIVMEARKQIHEDPHTQAQKVNKHIRSNTIVNSYSYIKYCPPS